MRSLFALVVFIFRKADSYSTLAYRLAQPLTQWSPCILSRTSGDVSRAEFEALQAEVRRMRESATKETWPASPPPANAGEVSVSVALGHAAGSQQPPPSAPRPGPSSAFCKIGAVYPISPNQR